MFISQSFHSIICYNIHMGRMRMLLNISKRNTLLKQWLFLQDKSLTWIWITLISHVNFGEEEFANFKASTKQTFHRKEKMKKAEVWRKQARSVYLGNWMVYRQHPPTNAVYWQLQRIVKLTWFSNTTQLPSHASNFIHYADWFNSIRSSLIQV